MMRIHGKRRFHYLCLIVVVLLPTMLIAPVTTARQTIDDSTVLVAGPRSTAATPSGDQSLRLAGSVSGIATLDPALVRDLESAFMVRQVFRGLTSLDHALQPVPELAERIEISPDEMVYRFMLRADATFQDGRPILADDVAYSFTRALDPRTADGERSLLAGPTYLSDIDGAAEVLDGSSESVRGLTVIDDRTLEIRLVAPRGTFLMKLAGAAAVVVDRTNVATGGDWWRTPNGTGPFAVDDWSSPNVLVLKRFNEFSPGAATLKRVEVRLGTDAAQPFNLYQAGTIDLARVPTDALDRVLDPTSDLADHVLRTPMFAVSFIAFSPEVAPMDDPHIRRAVQLAFPRDKVIDVGLNGYVSLATGMVPMGMLGREWAMDLEPYDPEAARQEIAKSRYESSDRVPPIRIYAGAPAAAVAMRSVLDEELGLTVDVVQVEWSQFLDGLARGTFASFELYWGADYPDPESFLWSLFGSMSSDNYLDYQNREFDDVLRRAAKTLDPDRRAALYQKAQALLLSDNVVVPVYFDVRYTLIRPELKGLRVTPIGILGLESVWMER